MHRRPIQAEANFEERLEFETLIADTSARLMRAPPEHSEEEVRQALDHVRRFFDADRCAIILVQEPRRVAHVRLASYAEGVEPVSPEVNLVERVPWASRRLLVERLPVRIPSLDDLPPEAGPERRRWQAMGVRSSLFIPIETGDEVRHVMGIQTVQREHAWPDVLVTRFRVLGELLVGCLERNAMLLDLRETEGRLQSGAELAGLAHYESDYAQEIFLGDERVYEICGVPATSRRGLDAVAFWMEHVHPADQARVVEMRDRLLAGRVDDFTIEYRYLHPTKGQRWIHHRAGIRRLDKHGRLAVAHGIMLDVTERRRADEELTDLSRRLIRAQEEERAKIARELHDDVTQRLAVLAIDAGRGELAAESQEQAEAMRLLREGLVRLSEDVHSLAYQLHSAVLEELGLVEALRAACERLGRRCGVQISMDLDPGADHLGGDASLCLFRVAQEALNNVARHSGGRAASVELHAMDGGVHLAVRDDGVGFDPDGPWPRKTLGLASMRERLRLVNGTLNIESAPGHGTVVLAWVPAHEAST